MIETNITKMFGIKYPIFSAPMGPFYTRDLALAVSEAGGLGTLSHVVLIGKDPTKETISMIEHLIEHTDKPFGFNVLTSRVNPFALPFCNDVPKYIMENTKAKEQCVYALTSAGSSKMLPGTDSFKKLRDSSQIKHFHVAPALWLAKKCVDAGVDGIVCTGGEGGGHQSYEKVSTLVLLQQIQKELPDIPKIACGGFATGESLAAALNFGAGAVAMGSRFIASKESEFHEKYKEITIPGKAQDTELFTGFVGPIRLWKNKYAESHELVASKEEKMAQEAGFTMEDLIKDQEKYGLIYEGDMINGPVLLGQSIGIIDSIKGVTDIIEDVMKSAEKAIRNSYQLIK